MDRWRQVIRDRVIRLQIAVAKPPDHPRLTAVRREIE